MKENATYDELLQTEKAKMFCVLDTETLGYKREKKELNQKVFDVGYKIINSKGRVFSKGSFIIQEFWRDIIEKYAFYREKIEYYDKYVKSGYSKVLPFNEVFDTIIHDCYAYDVNFLVAYNLGFDNRVISKTNEYFNNELVDLFQDFEKFDLYHVACQTILNTPKYLKWASEHYEQGHLNLETFNVSTGAESCFSFLIDEPTFIEQHTALSDVEIECEILVDALKTTKDYDISINSQSWRIVNNRKDKLYLLERANPSLTPYIIDHRKKQKEKKARKKVG